MDRDKQRVEAVVEIVRVCWPKKQAEAGRDAGFDSESRRSLHWHLQPEAARPVAWALCLAVLLSRPARLRVAGMTGPFLMLVGGHMHVGYIKLESFIKPCPGDEGDENEDHADQAGTRTLQLTQTRSPIWLCRTRRHTGRRVAIMTLSARELHISLKSTAVSSNALARSDLLAVERSSLGPHDFG